jgi:hypothetical protein
MTNSALIQYEPSHIPTGLADDESNPSADTYIAYLQKVQLAIVAHGKSMKPQIVTAVKMYHRGSTFIEIGEALKHTPQWASKHVKSQPGQKLLSLLAFYQDALSGPRQAQRLNMLWRIAKRNELLAPKTSIGAIETLNKMDPALKSLGEITAGNSGTINVQINQNLASPLDG